MRGQGGKLQAVNGVCFDEDMDFLVPSHGVIRSVHGRIEIITVDGAAQLERNDVIAAVNQLMHGAPPAGRRCDYRVGAIFAM